MFLTLIRKLFTNHSKVHCAQQKIHVLLERNAVQQGIHKLLARAYADESVQAFLDHERAHEAELNARLRQIDYERLHCRY